MSAPTIDLDLRRTPFSRRGSYLAVSRDDDGYLVRTVRGDVPQRELFRIVLAGDVTPDATASAGRLSLTSGPTRLDLALSGEGRLILRMQGGSASLDLAVRSQYDVVLPQGDATWRFIVSGARRNYLLHLAEGAAHLETGWDGVKDASARIRLEAGATAISLVIDEFTSSAPAPGDGVDIDAVATAAEEDFASWSGRHGVVSADVEDEDGRMEAAARLAAFVTWGALVPSGGALRRESMLMSKNHMTNVWAWDHCFNAMALWRDPDAAADQLMTVFDHQDVDGALPDYVNDAGLETNFVKPPIHGWAIDHLLDRGGLTDDAVAALAEPLARWTDWWFTHRDFRGDGVPSYTHGNDSGWDNSTVFAEGVPIQSPDLLAFLALQMGTSARIADRLGRESEAERWRERSAQTREHLIERFWVDGRFVARHTMTGAVIASDSLLTLMPLVLGDLLPSAHLEAEIRRLVQGGYLTEHGLATEPVSSPFYDPDGYWRGPVWAPTTLLLVDGLARAGHVALASDISRRFLRTCARSGMAENFDALTGDGLRDLSMTWTASAFLTLVGGHAITDAIRTEDAA